MKPLVTTVEEVLRKAIQAEDESRAFYLRLAERAANREVLRKLMEISDRQVAHRVHLEKKYRKEVGGEPPPPDLPRMELPAEVTHLDMARALKIVRDRERDAESNFRFMAERVPGTELEALFWELADFKWKHKAEAQAEMDRVGSDPESFLKEL